MNMVADGVVCDRARWRWSHDITCMRAAAPGESTAGASSKVLLDRRPSCTETSSTAAAGERVRGHGARARRGHPSATPRHATPVWCNTRRRGVSLSLGTQATPPTRPARTRKSRRAILPPSSRRRR